MPHISTPRCISIGLRLKLTKFLGLCGDAVRDTYKGVYSRGRFPFRSERSSHEKSRRKEVSPDKTRCHGSPARQHSTRSPASQTSKKVGSGKPHRGEHLHASESDATRPKSITARGPEQQAP